MIGAKWKRELDRSETIKRGWSWAFFVLSSGVASDMAAGPDDPMVYRFSDMWLLCVVAFLTSALLRWSILAIRRRPDARINALHSWRTLALAGLLLFVPGTLSVAGEAARPDASDDVIAFCDEVAETSTDAAAENDELLEEFDSNSSSRQQARAMLRASRVMERYVDDLGAMNPPTKRTARIHRRVVLASAAGTTALAKAGDAMARGDERSYLDALEELDRAAERSGAALDELSDTCDAATA